MKDFFSRFPPSRTLVSSVILLFIGASLFPGAGRDDSYIHYWQAFTLTEYGSLLNYNGQFLEQSSSLAYVFVLSMGRILTPIGLPVLGQILSVGFGVLTVLAFFYLTDRSSARVPNLLPYLLVTSLYFVYWSFSGMETTFYSFVTLVVLGSIANVLSTKSITLPKYLIVYGSIIPWYLLARPESIAVVVSVLAGLLVIGLARILTQESRNNSKILVRTSYLLFLTLSIFTVIELIRYAYFGSLLPHSVQVKIVFNGTLPWVKGFKYLLDQLGRLEFFILIPLALVGTYYSLREFFEDRSDSISVLSILFVCALVGFTVLSGGDWMEAGRFLVALIPLVLLLAGRGISKLPISQFLSLSLILTILFLQLITLKDFVHTESRSLPLWSINKATQKKPSRDLGWPSQFNRPNLKDAGTLRKLKTIVPMIQKRIGKPVVILSDQGGFIPYKLMKIHYPDLTWIDRRGLVSSHLSECKFLRNAGFESTRRGIDFSWLFYIRSLEKINTECFEHAPNILHIRSQMGLPALKQLKKLGFLTIFGDHKPLFRENFKGKVRVLEANYLALEQQFAEKLGLGPEVKLPLFGPRRFVGEMLIDLNSI